MDDNLIFEFKLLSFVYHMSKLLKLLTLIVDWERKQKKKVKKTITDFSLDPEEIRKRNEEKLLTKVVERLEQKAE